MLQFLYFYCALVNAGWSSWSDWTQCSASCEMGLQARDRVCNRPAPQYGQQCNGSAREVQWCNNYTCPGIEIN